MFRPLYVGIVREGKSIQQVEENAKTARDLFARMDCELSRQMYIAGDAFTLVNIAVGPLVYRWYKLGFAEPDTGNLYRLSQCVEKRPAFAKHVMVEPE